MESATTVLAKAASGLGATYDDEPRWIRLTDGFVVHCTPAFMPIFLSFSVGGRWSTEELNKHRIVTNLSFTKGKMIVTAKIENGNVEAIEAFEPFEREMVGLEEDAARDLLKKTEHFALLLRNVRAELDADPPVVG